MNKRITRLSLIFFLFTLISAEAGWTQPSPSLKKLLSFDSSFPSDDSQDDDCPADAEEDTTESREIDEYDTDVTNFSYQVSDQLLNLHYTYHHLLFKEHFEDSVVPPPKA